MMPQMNGFELCRQIKNDIQISHIPVILLTARYDHTGITTGYKSGADAYIPKPFDIDSLKAVIGNIFQNREKYTVNTLLRTRQFPPDFNK